MKLRNLAFSVWEGAHLWAHWIHSFHMHLSYLRLQSCFLDHLKEWQICYLHSPSSSAITMGGGRAWQHPLDPSFGSPHSHLKARDRWWLWYFLFIYMARDIFISQYDVPLFLIVVVQFLGCVWLFVTPWTVACQASLSFTVSWSLLKLISIESEMPSNHLILCHPLVLLPSIFPSIRAFSNESAF